jgi:hypothetical protein
MFATDLVDEHKSRFIFGFCQKFNLVGIAPQQIDRASLAETVSRYFRDERDRALISKESRFFYPR